MGSCLSDVAAATSQRYSSTAQVVPTTCPRTACRRRVVRANPCRHQPAFINRRSRGRLKTLVKKELTNDAEKYGDDRRSFVVERPAAAESLFQRFPFSRKLFLFTAYLHFLEFCQMTPTEPTTVVLSRRGWLLRPRPTDRNPSPER